MNYDLLFLNGTQPTVQIGTQKFEYSVNEISISNVFEQSLPSRLADLVEISSAMYAADRLCLRPCSVGRSAHRQWARNIHLTLPVRDLSFWSDNATQCALIDLARFMTGDLWSFTFSGSAEKRYAEKQQHFHFRTDDEVDTEICLFSGGLDSFAGVLHRLQSFPKKHLFMVSGAGNTRLAVRQRELVEIIHQNIPNRARHMGIPYAVFSQGIREEPSQRTRGILYLTFGAIAAVLAKTNKLHVYENGIGALNLRFDGAQTGLQNSRPVHPVTLYKFSKLITLITGQTFEVKNPFINHTKAELCQEADGKALRQGLQRTWSCDHAPRTTEEQWHCGRCTSCLLRRSSIFSAGLADVDSGDRYKIDVLSPTDLPEIKKFEMRKAEYQASVLQELLTRSEPWMNLKASYPLLGRAAAVLDARGSSIQTPFSEQTISLFQRYVKEWNQFPGRRQIRRTKKSSPTFRCNRVTATRSGALMAGG